MHSLSVDLKENSGPVSPPYQFHTHILIETMPDGAVVLHHKDERKFSGGVAQEVTDINRPLTAHEVQDIVSFLAGRDAGHIGGDFARDKRGRIGISFNFLEFDPGTPGSGRVRIDYTLSDLSDEKFAAQKQLIDFVKSLR